ncbi:hypothetical protein A0256_22140 [Mucilaginibacter sp. PAMC 26640]|nr:hypothetical protein A0256_22140 [Mucilaginibacter sp. PAMC 26640]
MKSSPIFSINLKDLTKGLIVAIGSAVITALQTTLQAGSFTVDWKSIGTVALAAGLSYLLKNFFTPAQSNQQQGPINQQTILTP